MFMMEGRVVGVYNVVVVVVGYGVKCFPQRIYVGEEIITYSVYTFLMKFNFYSKKDENYWYRKCANVEHEVDPNANP